MNPIYCPKCGNFHEFTQVYDFFESDLHKCDNCDFVFGIYTEEDLAYERNQFDQIPINVEFKPNPECSNCPDDCPNH